MLNVLILIATHLAMLGLGFLIGIYVLPILTAPKGPDVAALQATATGALYKGRFERNLKGSDFLHWGEGEVRVLPDRIAHEGHLAPGPHYFFVSRAGVRRHVGRLPGHQGQVAAHRRTHPPKSHHPGSHRPACAGIGGRHQAE